MATLTVITLLPHIVAMPRSTARAARALGGTLASRSGAGQANYKKRITLAKQLPADQEDDDQDGRAETDDRPMLDAALRCVGRHGRRRIARHRHQAGSAATGGGAPTFSANLPKNW